MFEKIANISNYMRPVPKKIVLSVVVLVLLLLIGGNKSGFHIDEVYTFGLSNHQYNGSIRPTIVQNQIYSGTQLWNEYAAVSPEHRFDYKNVLANQAADVHPPLYYIFIHTICSFFPETLGMWMGLIVNAMFALIVYWQLIWLFKCFTYGNKSSVLFATFFILGMGFINNLVFFRMYMLLTVWTNAILILFLNEDVKSKGRWHFYFALTGCIWGGLMTQYYFSIFCFFVCIVYAWYVIKERNWIKFVRCSISIAAGIGLAYITFPSMIKHIFFGYRGEAAFESVSEGSFWEPFWKYLEILERQVFGGNCVFIALLIGLCILYLIKAEQARPSSEAINKYILMLVPFICYIAVIIKISPYNTDRYVMCVMGILYVSFFSLFINISAYYSRHAVKGVIILAVIALIGSYRNGVPYMQIAEKNNTAMIESRKDSLCLYVYASESTQWKIFPNYLEMTPLKRIIFVNYEDIAATNLDCVRESENLLTYITNDVNEDEVFRKLSDINPSLDTKKKLFFYGYSNAYYLE